MTRADIAAKAMELHGAGRLDEAIAQYELLLAEVPQDDATRFRLALALIAQRRPDDAATVLGPTDARTSSASADVYFHLANFYQGKLRSVQAAEWFQRAILARPEFVAAEFNLALALQNQGRLLAAAEQYRRALDSQPDLAEARHNLAVVLQMLGHHDQAVALYQDGLSVAPQASEFARYAVTASFYDPGHSNTARFALAEQFGHFLERSGDRRRTLSVAAQPERRLRIGYLTSDFRDHPIARNVAPLLANRDRQGFEVIAYADVERPDAVTERLKASVDLWRPIHGMGDNEIADRIQEDGVDILVCLAAHFDRNRPLICASRPAPIQVSFHDVTTSGSNVFDYLIADRIVCPARRSEQFRERVVRLPSIYVHAPIDDAPPLMTPNPRPITFGCLNNPAKLNNGVIALWARILAAVPDSRLVLKYGRWFEAADIRSRIATIFAASGVAAARLDFLGGQDSRADHLAHYNRIDIALDPYPFAGSTATFEALWMGVPVITFAGSTMMSRWSASILTAIRLDALVADSAEAYVATAVEVAQNKRLLQALRMELRERVRQSPLCDGRLRARQIERVYRALWRRWCAGAAA